MQGLPKKVIALEGNEDGFARCQSQVFEYTVDHGPKMHRVVPRRSGGAAPGAVVKFSLDATALPGLTSRPVQVPSHPVQPLRGSHTQLILYVDIQTAVADYFEGWLDCFGREEQLGRGLIYHARYLEEGEDPEQERTLQLGFQDLPGLILGFPKGEVWRILNLLSHDPGMRQLNFTNHQMGKLEQREGWYRQSRAAFNFLLDFVPNWKFAYRGEGPGMG